MKLSAVADGLALRYLTPGVALDAADATGAFCGDLMSDVLAHAPRGGILVTAQVHLNVVAVAVHVELAAVVFVSDRIPEPSVIAKATDERIALFVSRESAFDVAGRLYSLGLRGPDG